jgi:hypothetical protein
LYFDVDKGTLNGVKGTASMDDVKKAFPCFTGESKEAGIANCGGGIFFLNHNFFFYTFNDYIEIRRDFKGKSSHNIIGNSLMNVLKILGKPDFMKEVFSTPTDLDIGVNYYQRDWGTLACIEYDSVIVKVQLYYGKTIEDIEYCN